MPNENASEKNSQNFFKGRLSDGTRLVLSHFADLPRSEQLIATLLCMLSLSNVSPGTASLKALSFTREDREEIGLIFTSFLRTLELWAAISKPSGNEPGDGPM